jgi:elongation factor Tu
MKERDLLELVELEVRDLLENYSFNGYELPVVSGSAKYALEGSLDDSNELGFIAVKNLLDFVDS